MSYGARLAALEAKLTAMAPAVRPTEGPPPAAPTAAAEVPPALLAPEDPKGRCPCSATAARFSKIFNPDMAVIGNFLGAAGETRSSRSPPSKSRGGSLPAGCHRSVRTGGSLSGGVAGGTRNRRGLPDADEPSWRAPGKDQPVEGAVGKVNTLRARASWTDVPLVMKNLLGGEEGMEDAGIFVSKLVLDRGSFWRPLARCIRAAPAIWDREPSDVSWLGRLRGYRDITEGANLDLGVSLARGHDDAGPDPPRACSASTRRYGTGRCGAGSPGTSSGAVSSCGAIASSRIGRSPHSACVSAATTVCPAVVRRPPFNYSDRSYDSSLVDKGGSFVLTYSPSGSVRSRPIPPHPLRRRRDRERGALPVLVPIGAMAPTCLTPDEATGGRTMNQRQS